MGFDEFVRLAHILSAAVLFGTGLGIAFFAFVADRFTNRAQAQNAQSPNPQSIAGLLTVLRIVVLADFVFTAPAVFVQLATGSYLIWSSGFDPLEPWLVTSLCLFVLIGACWLPVVGLQIRMRNAVAEALRDGTGLPAQYHRDMALWFWLGWPAFLAVLAIYLLMLFKPALW